MFAAAPGFIMALLFLLGAIVVSDLLMVQGTPQIPNTGLEASTSAYTGAE